MAVIKDYYNSTKDFMRCTGLSRQDLQNIGGNYSISCSGVDFNYHKYRIPEQLCITDSLEFLLYSGGYGSFPVPRPAPSCLSEREKRRLGLDYDSWGELYDRYLDESCLDDGFSLAISAVDFDFPDPYLSYDELYSVVWFLLCLREELVKANYAKRGRGYSSIFGFDRPVYYQKATYVAEWSETNNILHACAVSILTALQLFCSCTFFFNEEENYNFICNSWSVEDLNRLLPGYRCVTSYNAHNTLCSVLEMILATIEHYECIVKHVPVKTSGPSFWEFLFGYSKDTLVKKIFMKISRFEAYIKLL